jgi:hypothetical protein
MQPRPFGRRVLGALPQGAEPSNTGSSGRGQDKGQEPDNNNRGKSVGTPLQGLQLPDLSVGSATNPAKAGKLNHGDIQSFILGRIAPEQCPTRRAWIDFESEQLDLFLRQCVLDERHGKVSPLLDRVAVLEPIDFTAPYMQDSHLMAAVCVRIEQYLTDIKTSNPRWHVDDRSLLLIRQSALQFVRGNSDHLRQRAPYLDVEQYSAASVQAVEAQMSAPRGFEEVMDNLQEKIRDDRGRPVTINFMLPIYYDSFYPIKFREMILTTRDVCAGNLLYLFVGRKDDAWNLMKTKQAVDLDRWFEDQDILRAR